MENSILNWTLKIIIHMSAFLSVWKLKNKILHIIFEFMYCAVISALPVLFVSFFIVAIRGSESVEIGSVMGWTSYLVVGILIYFIVSNRGGEKTIEDYLLLGALYIDEYIHDKSKIKRHKFTLMVELMHFLLLFIGLLWGIISLMGVLKILSVDTVTIGFVINLFLTYALFVYGKREEEIRKRRKAILGIFISLIWLIIVCVRINLYWRNMTQVGLADMFILFFSAVFTIPTIYEWVKNIPAKLVEPHSKKVYERRSEIIEKHIRVKNECKKLRMQFIDSLNEGIKIIIVKWKNGEKKRVITFFFYIFAVVGIMFAMIWIGNNLKILTDELIECVKLWYTNLNYGIQKIINKIFFLLFLVGIMLLAIFMAPRNYASKKNGVERIKYIVELIIFEIMFGFVAGMILFCT